MKFLNLTIAEDDIDKRAEGYHNLMSMLYGFIIAFTVTLVSGFWYYFFPRDINWNASQTILVLHLAAGAMSLLLVFIYFFLHQKDKKQHWWMIFTPWKLRQEHDESESRFQQRKLGHVFTWLIILVYGTGVLIAIPGLLFLMDIIWMQGYYSSQLLNVVHFWASLAIIPILFVHLLWVTRKGNKS